MVPYLLSRVLKYGPLDVIGYIRGILEVPIKAPDYGTM